MPDWEKFEKSLDKAIEEASVKTDEKLASGISSVTRLTDEEVIELFPETTDAQNLVELMKIVKSAEDRNVKITRIVENSEKFGGVVLTLLSKFV
jgi:hypothetical protein